jgi:two-component system, OmpR family, response regulator
MRILIVEDDTVLADSLLSAMGRAGYLTEWVASGEEADDLLARSIYDLVILDLGLPKLDGLQVLYRLRKRKIHLPVLILTARNTLEDRVKGLDLGADDYLTKPFDLPELEARVRALYRRILAGSSNEITCGPLRLDLESRGVTIGGISLELSSREVGILELLLRRPGRLLSKEQIRDNLHGWEEDVSDNAIEVYIHRLRKKLESSGVMIRTIRGLGYLMECSKDE